MEVIYLMINEIEYVYKYVYKNGESYYGAIVFHSLGRVKKFISDHWPGNWVNDRIYKVAAVGPEFTLEIEELKSN